MIKNLIFDIGGVLVDFRPAGVLKDMGISAGVDRESALA